MSEELAITSSKIRALENIADGTQSGIDATQLKSKIASFILAHADKVMDTVAPLEQLREMLSEEYITRAQAVMDDPELTTGRLSRMIQDIQQMNLYSMGVLNQIIEADKVQAAAASGSPQHVVNTQLNILNLDDAGSRSKVTNAVEAISRLLKNQPVEGEVTNDQTN